MTTKRSLKALSKPSSTPRPKPRRTVLGRSIEAGLREVLAHKRGKKRLAGYEIKVPDRIDVAGIRHKLNMSQRQFAGTFGLDITAIHAWEQDRRQPERAARILLTVIQNEPEAVCRALGV